MPRFRNRLRLLLGVLKNRVEAIRSSFLDTSKQLLSNGPGSTSIHSRWSYGNAVVEEVAGVDVCFGLALAIGFPVLLSNAIDVVVLGLLRHLRHILVYSVHDHDPRTSFITQQGLYHDLDSVTSLMVTDSHLHSWTDLSVFTDPFFYLGCCNVSR